MSETKWVNKFGYDMTLDDAITVKSALKNGSILTFWLEGQAEKVFVQAEVVRSMRRTVELLTVSPGFPFLKTKLTVDIDSVVTGVLRRRIFVSALLG